MSCDGELDPERLALDSSEFSRRAIELAAGEEVRVDSPGWRDAIVFLTAGEIEVECRSGERRRFSYEATLCLVPTVRLLRGCGAEPARLVAISRRPAADPDR